MNNTQRLELICWLKENIIVVDAFMEEMSSRDVNLVALRNEFGKVLNGLNDA